MMDIDAGEYIQNWRMLALRGALAALFGILVILWPTATIQLLVVLFGAYAFLSGIFALAAVLTGRISSDHKWLVAVEGGIGLLIGFVTFFYPRITVGLLLFFVAMWALVYGVVQIVAAVNLRDEIEHEWMLGFSGLLSVLLGIVFLAFPVEAVATIAFLFGMVAFVMGAVTVVFALRLRSVAENGTTLTEEPQAI